MKWYLQILQEYADPSVATELRTYAVSAIELVKNVDEPFANQCRGAFYVAALLADLWLDQPDQALNDCAVFTQDGRNTYETNYSLYYYWIKAMMQKKKTGDLTSDEENELQEKLAECGNAFVENCIGCR